MTLKSSIKKLIQQTIEEQCPQHIKDPKEAAGLLDLKFSVEYPPSSKMGDYSTNLALILSKELNKRGISICGNTPEKVAKKFLSFIQGDEKVFKKVEIVKPGFINFYLTDEFLKGSVKSILKAKDKFGHVKSNCRSKIQVEFISANPTGPLTLANGRGGFSGDVLASVLELAGHKVQREYYVNDYGEQVRKLGHSILKDKEAQYKGKYIDELAQELEGEKDVEKLGKRAADIIVKKYIQPVCEKVGIKFDNWFLESSLHKKRKVKKLFKELQKNDLVYKKDGAWWLKTKDSKEDDKDRVLIKASGDETYFLGDIAYHWNKFAERKFDKVINLWGADHHGYVGRMQSAMELIGHGGKLDILLMQLVRLVKDGKEIKMSKRKGVYVLLEELVDEVGLDVARFFFLMHANNKAMDFDLKLAKEKSQKNPVYYVQYAHARISSIIKKTKGLKKYKDKDYKLQTAERELIKELIKWPELIEEVAQSYEVHKIPFYCTALADKFHDFYEKCKVIEGNKVNSFRLDLISATSQVLKNSLKCLGVSAPEEM